MKETETLTIESNKWTVQQFPATRGLQLATKLIKMAGPGVATLGGMINGTMKPSELMDADLDGDVLSNAVTKIVGGMDEVGTPEFIKELLSDTRLNGEEVVPKFDLIFMANYGELVKVLAFVIKVNFASFFGGGGNGLQKQQSADQ